MLLAGGSLIDIFLYRGEMVPIAREGCEGRWRGHFLGGLPNGC